MSIRSDRLALATGLALAIALIMAGSAQAGTTKLVENIAAGDFDPWQLTAYQGRVFFSATTPGEGRELWKSDGTRAGTKLVRGIWPGAESSGPWTSPSSTASSTSVRSATATGTSCGALTGPGPTPGASKASLQEGTVPTPPG